MQDAAFQRCIDPTCGYTLGIREYAFACPKCGEPLRIIRAKKSKKRFVGCSNYPDCKTSYPLPQYGDIIALGTTCEQCDSPKIKVISKGRRPWEICLDTQCPTKEEYRKKAKKS